MSKYEIYWMDKDLDSLPTYVLFADLEDLFQFACQHDAMELTEYLKFTKESGFNHLVRVLRSRLINNE